MATQCYYATAAWFATSTEEEITHLLIHAVENTKVYEGVKKSKAEVIQLMQQFPVFTAEWDYKNFHWRQGAKVNIVNGYFAKFLRSDANRTEKDNLAHLLPGGNLAL